MGVPDEWFLLHPYLSFTRARDEKKGREGPNNRPAIGWRLLLSFPLLFSPPARAQGVKRRGEKKVDQFFPVFCRARKRKEEEPQGRSGRD